MKKIFYLFSFVLLLSSCSSEQSDLKNYIPAEAKSVLMINNKTIVSEIKWDVLFGKGKLEFKMLNNILLKTLAENPLEAGISLNDKSFVFTTDSAVCALLPLSSPDDLSSFLSSNNLPLKEEDGFSFIKKDESITLLKDGMLAILWGAYDEKSAAAFVDKIQNSSTPKLIISKAHSLEAIDSDSHLAFYGEDNPLFSTLTSAAKGLVTTPAQKGKVGELVAFFNFKNGKLEAKTKQYYESNSAAIKAYQKTSGIAKMMAGVNVDNAILNAGVSLDLMPFLMAQENEGTKHLLDSLLSLYAGASSEMIASVVEGDFFLSFNKLNVVMGEKVIKTEEEQNDEENIDFVEGPSILPDFNAAFTLKDTVLGRMGLVRALMDFAPSVQNSVYYFSSARSYMFFKGYNVYFTSDTSIIRKVMNATPTDVNASLHNFSNALQLNFKELSKKLPVQFFPQIVPFISVFEKNLNYLSYSVQPPKGNVLEGDFVIEGSNKEENILLSIIKMSNELNGATTLP